MPTVVPSHDRTLRIKTHAPTHSSALKTRAWCLSEKLKMLFSENAFPNKTASRLLLLHFLNIQRPPTSRLIQQWRVKKLQLRGIAAALTMDDESKMARRGGAACLPNRDNGPASRRRGGACRGSSQRREGTGGGRGGSRRRATAGRSSVGLVSLFA